MSASASIRWIYGSGLFGDREAPDWHPARDTDRLIFREAAALCERRGVSISKLALQFSSQNPDFPTTLFSSSHPEFVRRNVQWHEETFDPELLADVQRLLSPVRNKQWDYDQRVKELSKEKTIPKRTTRQTPTQIAVTIL